MRQALAAALGREVAELVPVAGGDLNAAYRATLADGREVFVKTAPDAVAGAYAAEAAGLRWIAEARGGPPVPEVLAVDERFLALGWVPGGGTLDEQALGRSLALLHRAGAPGPGAPPPGTEGPLRLGPLELPNDPAGDWPAFYAQRRLLEPAAIAARRGALNAAGLRAVEAVAARIDVLAGPAEPTARLHGDLWTGNVLAGADGRPWLIDPAAHGGHREVDLAMLELFGSPGPALYAAYDEVWPRAEGARERVALWQLFPLLVHAILFGGSYGAAVRRAAERYG
ncbi:fructosamine kinase family protein [Baekduia soli]|uniref:Fructosamine kinase family protein n=1 Tax=Baekduia soli TaxID=496014 RepID=A0A5B8U2S8_9ACTN|nr:fructosamine kinase family protein [Baekduia soli]QEC47314.1 fructosamine kinase family protein [Baekduia soli]